MPGKCKTRRRLCRGNALPHRFVTILLTPHQLLLLPHGEGLRTHVDAGAMADLQHFGSPP